MERFTDIIDPDMSADEFRAGLITLHNSLTEAVVAEFYGEKNGIHGGDTMEVFAPHPRDKADLLDLAVDLCELPDDTIELKAMRLGAAVLVVHPFLDGNGRISRAVHATLAGKTYDEIQSMGIITPHSSQDSDSRARQVVDLKPPRQLNTFLNNSVYTETETEPRRHITTLDNDRESIRVYGDVLSRLNTDEQQDLKTVYDIFEEGTRGINSIHRDMDTLDFALSRLSEPGKLFIKDEQTLSTGKSRFMIDLPRTLARLDPEGLQKFIDDIWEYRRILTEVKIRSLSSDSIGSEIIGELSNGLPATTSKVYIVFSKNLLSNQ